MTTVRAASSATLSVVSVPRKAALQVREAAALQEVAVRVADILLRTTQAEAVVAPTDTRTTITHRAAAEEEEDNPTNLQIKKSTTMTNLLGKWIVAETLQFNDEKGEMEWTSVETILAKGDLDKEMTMLLKTEVEFNEDGTIDFLTSLPEGVSQEEIDAAVASGQIVLRNGMMLSQGNHWKVENGKNMSDTGFEGEVFGEKVGPWEEIKEVGDGMIEMMLYHLKKVE